LPRSHYGGPAVERPPPWVSSCGRRRKPCGPPSANSSRKLEVRRPCPESGVEDQPGHPADAAEGFCKESEIRSATNDVSSLPLDRRACHCLILFKSTVAGLVAGGSHPILARKAGTSWGLADPEASLLVRGRALFARRSASSQAFARRVTRRALRKRTGPQRAFSCSVLFRTN